MGSSAKGPSFRPHPFTSYLYRKYSRDCIVRGVRKWLQKEKILPFHCTSGEEEAIRIFAGAVLVQFLSSPSSLRAKCQARVLFPDLGARTSTPQAETFTSIKL